jgi:hypothetical protein
MAKKSAARLMRDAEEKKNQKEGKNYLQQNKCWDELESTYDSMTGLLSQHTALAAFGQNKELIAAVSDKDLLSSNFTILANDLKSLSGELTEIHSQHADKKGGTTDPNVLMNTIGIFEQYHLFMERHDAVVMPTAYHIIEQLDQAEKKLIAVGAIANDLTNPDVISDVEIISTSPIVTRDQCVDVGGALMDRVTNDYTVPGAVHESVTKPDFAKLTESFNALHAEEVPIVLIDKEVINNG